MGPVALIFYRRKKTLVKAENSSKHKFTIDFTIGKNPGKLTRVFFR